MFTGNQIGEAMDVLHDYGIKLYHACQYQDFVSYLKAGGIPSRQLLQDRGLAFTPFQTDSSDLKKGLFDKVFLNLQDFGWSFHSGGNSTPNPYGPILIEVSPTSSLYMSDLAVTLRSAGSSSFDRDSESLSTLDEFKQVFKQVGHRYYVKYKNDLRRDFPNSNATSPEISCTFPGQLLSIDHFQRIIVDPISFISGKTLRHYVSIAAKRLYSNLDIFVKERTSERLIEYQDLYYGVDCGWRSASDVIRDTENPDLDDWAEQILAQNLDYQFNRFSKYLAKGTLNVIGNIIAQKKQIA